MRALIVGLGSIGRRHARNWAKLGLGEVLVCRQTDRPLPEPLGFDAPTFNNLEQALDAQPDVVIVCNPSSLHVATARQAIAAGAHVLVEKPIGHTVDGIPDLLHMAEQARLVLMTGYNLRFASTLARFRELVQAGAIGRPLSARGESGEFLPDWHPWEDYRTSYSGRRDLGGGPLLTFSHEIDALCWVLGQAPRRVLGAATRSGALEIDTDDVVDVVLQFGSGVQAAVHVDYLRRAPRRAIEVLGEDGILRWEYDANRIMHYTAVTRAWRTEEGDPRWTRNDMFLRELDHLAACVRGEAEPLIDGRQGAAVLAIALAAQQSSDAGRAVDLEQEGEPVSAWLSALHHP